MVNEDVFWRDHYHLGEDLFLEVSQLERDVHLEVIFTKYVLDLLLLSGRLRHSFCCFCPNIEVCKLSSLFNVETVRVESCFV